jgi:hypothetical protein
VAKLSLAVAALALAYAMLVPDSEDNTRPRAGLSATAGYGEALERRVDEFVEQILKRPDPARRADIPHTTWSF